MASNESKKQLIKDNIKSYPDFPKPGVIFRDIFSVLQNPEIFAVLKDLLIYSAKSFAVRPDVVVALDSRGFLFGTLVALDLQIPFVPIRKKGKLPGPKKTAEYSLEYGTDTLEISTDAIEQGSNVLIVDDLLGTGGTLQTACSLVKDVGGNVSGCLVVIELKEFNGRAKIKCPLMSLVQY
ncbi:adenine phosphoribosyltransferase-like [Coccinella septempunctata]|uniref:adenine phosphoribosyltransferase-like n=1 Tax=Coccinella septempunctata TaxID=41139 RepID=UPI001D06F3F1|nr:adenine phosphoribosyltransferase-like [Coccinella septempunctata]